MLLLLLVDRSFQPTTINDDHHHTPTPRLQPPSTGKPQTTGHSCKQTLLPAVWTDRSRSGGRAIAGTGSGEEREKEGGGKEEAGLPFMCPLADCAGEAGRRTPSGAPALPLIAMFTDGKRLLGFGPPNHSCGCGRWAGHHHRHHHHHRNTQNFVAVLCPVGAQRQQACAFWRRGKVRSIAFGCGCGAEETA
jgi:hypothetical protein